MYTDTHTTDPFLHALELAGKIRIDRVLRMESDSTDVSSLTDSPPACRSLNGREEGPVRSEEEGGGRERNARTHRGAN